MTCDISETWPYKKNIILYLSLNDASKVAELVHFTWYTVVIYHIWHLAQVINDYNTIHSPSRHGNNIIREYIILYAFNNLFNFISVSGNKEERYVSLGVVLWYILVSKRLCELPTSLPLKTLSFVIQTKTLWYN